jgi:hemolysin activation/secretion protein
MRREAGSAVMSPIRSTAWATQIAFAGLSLLSGLSVASAAAQTPAPSRLAPQSLRPEAPAAANVVLPGEQGLVAPANAERLSVEIGKVVVEGGFPELKEAAAALAAPLEGRKVSLAQIYALANAIEQAYASAGFVLARVVVPPQKLQRRGPLRLVVVDGFIEAIDAKGLPERERAAILVRASALIGQRHLRLSEIERRLLLAADLPGASLKSTLTRGASAGGAILVLEGTQRLVVGSLGYDNRLPAAPGNRGVQMMMSKTAEQGEFMVVSYWDSIEAIKGYAGEEYTKVHDLPRDNEFLIDHEPLVRHFDLPVNFWQS